jgi:hypothetical protein
MTRQSVHAKATCSMGVYAFSEWLYTITKRDYAIEKAKEYYYLGHNRAAVRLLIAEARLHNHKAIQLKRGPI